jgi:phosphoserine phosphatase RsbU/P
MGIRWKLLLLLLFIAIVPLFFGRAFGLKYFHKVGDALVEQSRNISVSNMEKRLDLLVDSYSTVLQHGRENMEMSLTIQAHEVEKALAGEPEEIPDTDDTHNLHTKGKLSDDLIPSPFHFRTLPSGKMDLVKVSYGKQVFSLSPGVKKDAVKKDRVRLSSMTPVYKKISDKYQDLLFWQYTSLENGLHSEYPGHREIPEGFDHRLQPWYREALQEIRVSPPWFYPFVDPVTSRPVTAATLPVKRPDGTITGITALVTPLSSLLEHKLLYRNIPSETKPFMSTFFVDPISGKRSAMIFASDEHNEVRHRDWNDPVQIKKLESSDSEMFEKMLDDLESGIPNQRRMTYKKIDSLWVYRSLGVSTFLLLITPYEEILKPARQNAEHIQDFIDSFTKISRYVMTGTTFLIIFLSLYFSKTVTKPTQALSEGAMKLMAGDFDAKVNITSRDEFGEMGRVFNLIGPQLKEHYNMRHSLVLAMEVQQKLLPKNDPEIEGLDISGKSRYCDETGGDYYDFLHENQFSSGKIRVAVGDVADHGIPSALLMATARALLRQSSSGTDDLARIVSEVNVQLTRDIGDSGQFMTMFLGAIDRPACTFRWVRAGHEPAIIYDTHTEAFEELKGPGMALGVDENTSYIEFQREIKAGEIIVIGTDGVWETHDSKKEIFGKERLKNIIKKDAQRTASEIIDSIITAVDTFRSSLQQEDDITLIVIKVNRLNKKSAQT